MNPASHSFVSRILRKPLAFILLLSLMLLGGVFAAWQQGQRTALIEIKSLLDERVKVHDHYFLEALGKFELIPEIVATAPQVRALLTHPDPEHVRNTSQFLEEIARKVQAARIFVMDENGTTLAADKGPDGVAIIGQNYRFRPYFQQALAGHTGHFIGIAMTSRIASYYVARPVLIAGQVRGVVALRVPISREAFQVLVSRYWSEQSEIALVTDTNGVIFTSPIEPWLYHTITPLSAAARAAIDASKQYKDQALLPLAITVTDSLDTDMRLVRFKDLPGRSFIQKAFELPQFGGRIYLHIDAAHYWKTVATYTVVAALLALVFLLTAIAILQRLRYQTRLLEAAIRDPLTGLHTRLYMNEWLHAAEKEHERDPQRGFSLVLFDLDHFKKINDTHGHLVGDAVLKQVGQLIADSIRAGDLAVRFGGEELAVFVRTVHDGTAVQFAERIRKGLEALEIRHCQTSLHVTVSGGVAARHPGEEIDTLFARADEKLYAAKHQGRNRICG